MHMTTKEGAVEVTQLPHEKKWLDPDVVVMTPSEIGLATAHQHAALVRAKLAELALRSPGSPPPSAATLAQANLSKVCTAAVRSDPCAGQLV